MDGGGRLADWGRVGLQDGLVPRNLVRQNLNRVRRLGWLWLAGIAFLPALGLGAAVASSPEAGGMTPRMMLLVLQLGAILFAARLGGVLFEKARLPAVLGELTAGIFLGPYLLGSLPLPGLAGGLFPIGEGPLPVSPELYGICTLATIVLLFTVGLETDIGLLLRYSVAGSLVGIGGVVVSFLAGDLLAVLCSPWVMGRQLGFLDGPPLFLGIITTATSVGIPARILSEQRKLDSPEGVTVMAGAVVDDVLGIICLAVGMGIVTASRGSGRVDWAHIGMIGVKAVGIWLAATGIGLLAARRISRILKASGNPMTIAVLALGLALILAGLFEKAGLAMIVGAYVMGLSLAGTDIKHLVRERLAPIQALLVPVFFVVMGMLVDVRAFGSPAVLGFGLLYTAAAIAAKLAGCGIPALFCSFNTLGALRIGVGMLPRGEVTLIIAGTGRALGIIDGNLFGVIVLTTLVSSLATPPVLVRLFRHPKSGLRRGAPQEAAAPIAFRFPSALSAEMLVDRLLAEFQADGFFVHVLDRQEPSFQLRKDDIVIGFRRRGNELAFHCRPSEIPFVNTAMMEVVADLEQVVQEARRPAVITAIGRRVQDQTGGGVRLASLARYLSVPMLVPELRGTTKEAVIDELLERIRAAGGIHTVNAAREAVWQRERSLSTGMQHGIALPHARTDAAPDLVCAVGLKRGGLDFSSIDGAPTRIVALTLSPQSVAAPHMQFLAAISQALDERGRAALLAARSPAGMYAALVGIPPPRGGRRGVLFRLLSQVWPPRVPPSGLAAFLHPDQIAVTLKGRTREAVIDELLGLLKATGALDETGRVREAILKREAQMPTGLDHGLALPHARSDDVPALQCAMGISREGVDFGAPDGGLSRIILLTLSRPDAPGAHLRLMAMLGRTLDADRRARLLAAGSREEIWAVLAEAG